MKKLSACLRFIVILVTALSLSTGSYANHILAMDLYYTWQGGNTYKITAVIYGDCTPASASVFALLPTAQPQVCVFRNSIQMATISLNVESPTTGVDITPVCPAQVGNTQCENPSSSIPGITRFVYSALYTLPAPTTGMWQFAYFGQNTNSQAGRSINVTNIVNPGPTLIELVDTLNVSGSEHNSNAQFSVIPTPFFCLNLPDSYNPGAIDPDGDSLNVINLIPAMDAASTFGGCQFGSPVNYTGVAWNPPFTPISAETPLNVVAGSYSYDPTTGQLNFTPNAIQRSTVVYNVREFRAGSFIGSCQREMNFLVQSCVAPVPSGGIATVTNGIKVDSAHFSTCVNEGPFSFTFDPHESGTGNNITVTHTGSIPSATITITNNGTPNPHVVVSGTSTGITPGTYIFYLTYTDNNCPLQGTNTTAISVTIVGQPTLTHTVLSPITCNAKEAINIIPGGGGSPWKITQTGTVSHTFTGVTGSFIDSLTPGTYYFTIAPGTGVAAGTCTASDTVVIHSSVITGDTVLCKGSVTTLSDSYAGGTWSSSNLSVATIGITSGVISAVNTGTTVVTYTNVGCTTTSTISVVTVGPITGSNHICTGNTVTLSDTPIGGTWSSSASTIAAANASSGVITGVSAGSAIITYNSGTCGSATTAVTVNLSPTGIVGSPNICVGASTALSDLRSGGTWSLSNTSVATLTSNGPGSIILTGATAGTATISYTLAGGCFVTASVTVYPLPSAISGLNHVCTGAMITLSDTLSGGTWTSGTTSVATVTSGSGVVSGVVAGSDRITYTTAGGCSTTTSITVYQSPGAISGPSTACTGIPITLSDAQAGGTWSSSATSVATVVASGTLAGQVTGVTAGTTTITYDMPGTCLVLDTIVVFPEPAAITGPAHVCTGDTITLSDAVGGGTWSSNDTTKAVIDHATGVVSGITAGTIVVEYTTGGSCTVTDTITVYQAPSAISCPSGVCGGSSITLSDVYGGGTWSTANTAVATVVAAGSTTANVTGVVAGVAVITYTMPGSCARTDTITVLQPPSDISGNTHACTGLTTILSDAVSGGTWTAADTSVATIDTFNGTVTGVSAGSSGITYSLADGCLATATVTVDIQPSIGASTVNVCTNDTTILVSTPPGGLWSSNNTSVTIVSSGGTSGIISGFDTGTTVINYTLNGCTATTSVTIVSHLPPIAGGPDVCTGRAIVLSNSITGGVWSSGSTALATVDSAGGTVTGVSGGNPVITYYLGGSCIAFDTLDVHQSPDPGVITGQADMCVGYPTQLSDTVAGGVWGSSNTSASVTGGLVTGAVPGADSISYVVSTAYCSDTAWKAINIYAVPDSGLITGDTVVCLNNTIALSDTVSGGVWGSVQPVIATVSVAGMVTGLSAGRDTVTFTNSNPGCATTATHIVTVYNIPGVGPISGLNNVCMGAIFALSDSAMGGVWTSSNTLVATINSVTGIVHANTLGMTVITYTTDTNAGGCYSIATDTVTVSSQPPFSINGIITPPKCYADTNGSIMVSMTGDTTQLVYSWSGGSTVPSITGLAQGTYTLTVRDTATQCAVDTVFNVQQPDSLQILTQVTEDICKQGNGTILVAVSGGTSPYAYLWPDNSTGNGLQNLHAGVYFLTVTDAHLCTDTLSISLGDNDCNLVVHDVITPNGDGVNDKWIIEGIDNYPTNSVQIFDKWGDMVYEKTGYNNDWEGTGKNGPLPDGTYFYIVKLNTQNILGGSNTFKGSILIKR